MNKSCKHKLCKACCTESALPCNVSNHNAGKSANADFVAKIDRWMVGPVWNTQCSNYFRAANGRVVTQWPRSARSFWEMTRRFRPADFAFSSHRAQSASVPDGQACTAPDRTCR